MEKIKKILSPGHSKDDTVMYGDPHAGDSPGEVTPSTNISHPASSADQSSNINTTAASSGIDDTKPAASAVPSHLSAAPDDDASTQSIRSGVIGGKPSAGLNLDSINHPTTNPDTTTNFSQRDLPDRSATTGGVGTTDTLSTTTDPLSTHKHKEQTHNFVGDPCPAGDVSQAHGYPHHFSGPHSTDTANRLDPHIPGEFPTDSGEDIHFQPSNTASSLSSTGMADTASSSMGREQEQSTYTRPITEVPGYADQRYDPARGNISNAAEPHSIGHASSTRYPPGTATSTDSSHVSRDAAVGTAVGAAGIGAYEASKGRDVGPDETGPASKTIGPHKSNVANVVDPRVLPEPEKQANHGTAGGDETGPASKTIGPHQSNIANVVDPRVLPDPDKQTSHNTAGGDQTGPASKTIGPHKSNIANVVDPRVLPVPEEQTGHTVGPDETGPATKTIGPHSTNVANVVDPRVLPDPEKQSHHNTAESTALAGGAGAAGMGIYEASRHAGSTAQDPASFTTGPHQSNIANIVDPRVQPEPEKMKGQDKSHHYGRDAAVAGGAGAAGVAGWEATQKDHLGATQTAQQPLTTPTGAPADSRVFDQTQKVPGAAQASGGWVADSKAQQKLEKEQAKEADKAHDRAVKENKQHAKDAEKAHNGKGEKKHGLLGFLHRDKKDTPEEKKLKEQGNLREADQAAHDRHQRELEAAAGAGTIDVAGASFEPGPREQQEHTGSASPPRVSLDEKGHHKLHKDPPAKVQREMEGKLRTTRADSAATPMNDGIVTEPHTGLPMNVGKYGSGHGGTDGANTIPGYHEH